MLAHIETGVENITFAIQAKEEEQRAPLTWDECEDTIWRTLLALHRRYNIERSQLLGFDQRDYFTPTFVFAGKTPDEQPAFYLSILHSDGLVETVADYGTIGSGAAYAELLLKNLYHGGLDINGGAKLAAYVIDEVKSIDPNCGGDTKVATVGEASATELSEQDIAKMLDEMRAIISSAYEEARKKTSGRGSPT